MLQPSFSWVLQFQFSRTQKMKSILINVDCSQKLLHNTSFIILFVTRLSYTKCKQRQLYLFMKTFIEANSFSWTNYLLFFQYILTFRSKFVLSNKFEGNQSVYRWLGSAGNRFQIGSSGLIMSIVLVRKVT